MLARSGRAAGGARWCIQRGVPRGCNPTRKEGAMPTVEARVERLERRMETLEGRLNDVLESLAERWEKLATEAKHAAVEAKRAADEIARLSAIADTVQGKNPTYG